MSTGISKFALATLLLPVVLFGLCSGPTSADSSQGNLASLRGKLIRYEELKSERLRHSGDIATALSALDYEENELPFVYVEDFDGDGASDYLMGTPNARLCGTAGCPYLLIDGRSSKIIGDFFGTVAVLKNRINQFPVIQAVSKRDIEVTNLQTFVFDGREYRLVSHSLLETHGIAEWHRSLKGDP